MAIIMMVMLIPVSVSAADDLLSAQDYILGTSVSGSITATNTSDVYRFELITSGKIVFNYTSNGIQRVKLKMYDALGKQMWDSSPYWNSTTQHTAYSNEFVLTKGVYYLSVAQSSGNGTYSFDMAFTSANETYEEGQGGNNNTIPEANIAEFDKNYIGQIALNDEVDVYKFELITSGKFTLNYTATEITRTALKLYDEPGKQIWNNSPYWNSTTGQTSYSVEIELTKGVYYLSISKSSGYGNYNFYMTFTSANETFEEGQGGNNNSITDADAVELNKRYIGQIALNDEVDVYGFELITSGKITLNYTAVEITRTALKLYDESGKQIWSNSPYWNSTTGQTSYSAEIELNSGIYYLSISKSTGYGTYTFSISDGGDITDPDMEPSEQPETDTALYVDGKHFILDITAKASLDRKVLIVAVYDGEGALIDLINLPQTRSLTSAYVVMPMNDSAKTLKIFLWNSISSIVPDGECEELSVENDGVKIGEAF